MRSYYRSYNSDLPLWVMRMPHTPYISVRVVCAFSAVGCCLYLASERHSTASEKSLRVVPYRYLPDSLEMIIQQYLFLLFENNVASAFMFYLSELCSAGILIKLYLQHNSLL